MTKQLKIYRDGRIHTIREGLTLANLKASGYFERHPGAVVCTATPSITTLNKWSENGVAKAVDGCKVEPDGKCQHGAPSWILVLGFI